MLKKHLFVLLLLVATLSASAQQMTLLSTCNSASWPTEYRVKLQGVIRALEKNPLVAKVQIMKFNKEALLFDTISGILFSYDTINAYKEKTEELATSSGTGKRTQLKGIKKEITGFQVTEFNNTVSLSIVKNNQYYSIWTIDGLEEYCAVVQLSDKQLQY